MRRILFALSFISIIFSCKEISLKKNDIVSSPELLQDSASIAQLYAEVLSKPETINDVFASSDSIAAGNPYLKQLVSYQKARLFTLTSQFKKADSIIAMVLTEAGDDTASYSLAKFYNLKGSLFLYQSHPEEGIQYLNKALQIYDLNNDSRQAAAIEFNIAQVFLSRHEYGKVQEYSMAAHKKLTALQDTLYLPIVKGLAAVSNAIIGKIKEAEIFATEGLEMSENYKNVSGAIFSKYAFGEIETQKGNYQTAIEHLKSSKELAIASNMRQVVLPNNAALLQSYLLLKEYENAVTIGEEALEMSEKMKAVDIRYNLLKNTSKAYAALGNHSKAFQYMNQAEEQYRLKSNESNQKIIHELLIKYDTEKKNNQILVHQKDLAVKNLWVIILIATLCFILLGFYFYRKNSLQKNKLLQQQKEKEISDALAVGEENERVRLAGELHDGIASNLVALKLQLEDISETKEATQKPLLLLEKTQKEIRYMAHQMAPVNFTKKSLAEAIKEFCNYCTSAKVKVDFVTNTDTINRDNNTLMMVYRAVQELIQNAIKHSGATHIIVQILENKNKLNLSVEDNGRGLDQSQGEFSNGFDSLKRRVNSFNGQMEIDSAVGRGTSLFITL